MLHVHHNAWSGRSPRLRQRDWAVVVLFIKYNKYICMSKADNLPSCIRIYSWIYSSGPIYRRILSTLPWVLPELCFAWKWTKNTKHILSMWYCHKYNWVWYVFWNVVTVKFWAPPIVSWIVQALFLSTTVVSYFWQFWLYLLETISSKLHKNRI